MVWFLLLALAVAVLAVMFAVENAIPITVRLLGWEASSSLALVLILTFMLGALTSLMVSVPAMYLRQRKKLRGVREAVSLKGPDTSESKNAEDSNLRDA